MTHPTDFRFLCAELADAYLRLLEHVNNDTSLGYEPSDDPLLKRARAALSAAPQRPSDEELHHLWEEAAEHFDLHDEAARFARLLLTRYGGQAAPVAVVERLPGPGDCDAYGQCWFWCRPIGCWEFRSRNRQKVHDTHWLPYYALSLPEAQP